MMFGLRSLFSLQNEHGGRRSIRKTRVTHVSEMITARAVTIGAEMVNSIGVTNDD